MVPITREQNIICGKTRLYGTKHEQTIISRQLFAGHMVGSRPIERKEMNNNRNYFMCVIRSIIVNIILTAGNESARLLNIINK